MPETIMPFYDEVQRFTEKVHNHVLHNILRRKPVCPGFV